MARPPCDATSAWHVAVGQNTGAPWLTRDQIPLQGMSTVNLPWLLRGFDPQPSEEIMNGMLHVLVRPCLKA